MKTVLITGATGSVGKATAMELAKSNCMLLGRNTEKLGALKSDLINKTGNKQIETYMADLSEPESVLWVAEEIRKNHKSLNALVNIAAIYKKPRLLNSHGIDYMFATNHLGPFILTSAL